LTLNRSQPRRTHFSGKKDRALRMMKLQREEFTSSSLQEYGNSSIKRAMTLVLKDDRLEQLFHRASNSLTNIDIQADLESELHGKLLKKVFHARSTSRFSSTRQTAMGKGVNGVDSESA
jgi:hypothetical protein